MMNNNQKMKKIALFGGSGQTGRHVVEKLLRQGHAVKALARDPQKIPTTHALLERLQGDVLDVSAVEKTVSGCDAVVSVFGHVKGSPAWLQTEGTKNILRAMEKQGIRKIISLSGGGLPYEKDEPKLADKIIRTIMKVAVPKILDDAVAHAEALKQSQAEWVIVRGPRLTNDAPRGTYRIGWVGVNASTKIARPDLADFIITQLDDNRFVRQMPFVSY
jgi:putative NADH-flavin reductase